MWMKWLPRCEMLPTNSQSSEVVVSRFTSEKTLTLENSSIGHTFLEFSFSQEARGDLRDAGDNAA